MTKFATLECVFVYACKSMAYADRVVGPATFTWSYLGHVSKKVEKHCCMETSKKHKTYVAAGLR